MHISDMNSLPEPLRGSEIGTFAHHSIVVRLPEIARRTLAENEFSPETIRQMEELIAEIPGGSIRELVDHSAPDANIWETYLRPYLGNGWLDVPWFFAEAYFYRRILEATGYFLPGWGYHRDPFRFQKNMGLQVSEKYIRNLAKSLSAWNDRKHDTRATMIDMLVTALWSNQADLSLWPADQEGSPSHVNREQAQRYLLLDDSARLIDYWISPARQHFRLDILADNAGIELICDLGLVDYLVSHQLVKQVHLHLKAHPTFVSDALPADIHQSLDFLAAIQSDPVQRLAVRLRSYIETGQLVLLSDFFWNSPLAMWNMPEALMSDFQRSTLVISKGDANYRRLLGDLHWPYQHPFEKILAYFPAPLVALRTAKSEVVVGLPLQSIERLQKIDPDWMVNGRWGMIQFFQPRNWQRITR